MEPLCKNWVDLGFLDYLLERKEYHTIYHSAKLFLDLFFKVHYQKQEIPNTRLNNISITWPPDFLYRLMKFLALLRLSVVTAYQLGTDLVFIYNVDNVEIRSIEWDNRIQPVLKNMMAYIGIRIHIKYPGDDHIQIEGKFKEDYLLPPMILKPRDFSTKFYQLYKDGKECDFSIHGEDGVVIKLHKMIFLLSEENIISTMLGENGDFVKLDFSSAVIKVMVDFLYLGSLKITHKRLANDGIELDELFRLANFMEMEEFISHCVNLYNSRYMHYTSEKLQLLGETYDNDCMKQLAYRRPNGWMRRGNGLVGLVCSQTHCSEETALEALEKSEGNVVSAIQKIVSQ